ncbi:hypothetical protein Tco_1350225, partial [Tanacetum coccineum]
MRDEKCYMKVATWDYLAFKLIILGWNVTDIQKKDKNEAKTDKTKHRMEKREKVKVKVKCFLGSFRNDLKAGLGVKLLTKALDL